MRSVLVFAAALLWATSCSSQAPGPKRSPDAAMPPPQCERETTLAFCIRNAASGRVCGKIQDFDNCDASSRVEECGEAACSDGLICAENQCKRCDPLDPAACGEGRMCALGNGGFVCRSNGALAESAICSAGECLPGLDCIGGRCARLCDLEFPQCPKQSQLCASLGAASGGAGVCLQRAGCAAGCPAGTTCRFDGTEDRCLPDAKAQEGDSCAALSCDAGLYCAPVELLCKRACDPLAPSCATGEVCVAESVAAGSCAPACDPLVVDACLGGRACQWGGVDGYACLRPGPGFAEAACGPSTPCQAGFDCIGALCLARCSPEAAICAELEERCWPSSFGSVGHCAPCDPESAWGPEGCEDGAPPATPTAELRASAALLTDSLKTVSRRGFEAQELSKFVVDRAALRALGKALFWEQQIGSDGQACASCHFHAGADARSSNQLNPGFRNQTATFADGDATFANGPLEGVPGGAYAAGQQLTSEDFPFHLLADPDNRDSAVLRDTNDICSSQGVFNAAFTQIGFPYDLGEPSFLGNGAIFNVQTPTGPALVRNTEPRHTPTTLNAVLNDRNFWDGRARSEFNGINPIGELDRTTRIARAVHGGEGGAELIAIRIENISTASQAVGPVLSELEMHFPGRRFPEVGRKLFDVERLAPLGLQEVAPDDSILGPYSRSPEKGINVTYVELAKRAFDLQWWDAPGYVVDLSGETPVVVQGEPGPERFTLLEYNFSLFFGLAVNEYESLLVSDDAPFDRFMEGDAAALSDEAQQGFRLFLGRAKCIACHSGPEFTHASATIVRDEPLERMVMGNGRVALYDNGFYNIGLRPTLEDIGIGGRIGPDSLPLSNSRRYQERLAKILEENPALSLREANRLAGVPRIPARPDEALKLLRLMPLDSSQTRALERAEREILALEPRFDVASAIIGNVYENLDSIGILSVELRAILAEIPKLLPDPVDPGPDKHNPFAPPLNPSERIAVDGAFKTPTLRNVELTAPYFHNGGQATLEQVMAFYSRGGDFAHENLDQLDPDILPLGLTGPERAALIAFLKALTDERVRYESAPFDHPSISLPNGGRPSVPSLLYGVQVLDDRLELPAVGRGGNGVGLGSPGAPRHLKGFLQP